MSNRYAGFMLVILAYAGAGGAILDSLPNRNSLSPSERAQVILLGPPIWAKAALEQIFSRIMEP